MNRKSYATLMSLGLAGMAIGVGSEISILWTVKQNWTQLLSLRGTVAISLYLLLLILGLCFLITGLWRTETLNRFRRRWSIRPAIRWMLGVGLLFVFTYIYLFSVWQPILSQPWIQLWFAMGFAQLILFPLAPQREQKFGWSEVAAALVFFLYPRVIQEMRALFADPAV